MCFVMSLIPATFFAIIGYFILFSSTKAKGAVGTFGKILAIWVFVIASLFPLMGAYATISGECPVMRIIKSIKQKGVWEKMMAKDLDLMDNRGQHRGPMHH